MLIRQAQHTRGVGVQEPFESRYLFGMHGIDAGAACVERAASEVAIEYPDETGQHHAQIDA
jgi:hypothetical protein